MSAPATNLGEATSPRDAAAQGGGGLFSRVPASSTRVLVVALELGVLGDYLMRSDEPSVNVTLWCWALLAAALMVTVAADVLVDRRRIALLGAAAFFAAVPGWRTTEGLVLGSGLAVLTLLVMSAWTAGVPGFALAQRALGAYIRAAWTGAVYIFAGVVPLLTAEARSRADLRNTYRRPFNAVLRGLALSVPVVLVLGALLMKADAGYEAFVTRLVHWDVETIVSHVFLTGAFTWLAGAYLYASLAWSEKESSAPAGIRLGAIEGGMVLAVVNVLFLSFILMQLRYLFGGTDHVLATAGLTYAEYARRGFFELVAVTGLTLPLLVGVSAMVQTESPREQRIHRLLATVLVVLLLALVVSALGRMRLYQAEYGWTLPRVHASALMMWISGCIVWFAATALRGDARRFTFGAVVSGLAILGALVIANPADLVVRSNAARVAVGGDFDAEHAASLRDDAIPALLEVLPTVEPTLDLNDRCLIRARIERAGALRRKDGTTDWRNWNISRARASNAVERHAATTLRILGADPCSAVRPAAAQEVTPPAGGGPPP